MTLPPEAAVIHPAHSMALVRLDEQQGITDGGIIIPDTAKRQPRLGTVMRVGPGRWCPNRDRHGNVLRDHYERKDMVLEPGMRVGIGPYNGHRVDEIYNIKDGHQWWLVETLPGVGMEWNQYHPGDVYVIADDEDEAKGEVAA